jgi:hypothetical protein
MKVLDTLTANEVKVSIVDVRAGALLNTLLTGCDPKSYALADAPRTRSTSPSLAMRSRRA